MLLKFGFSCLSLTLIVWVLKETWELFTLYLSYNPDAAAACCGKASWAEGKALLDSLLSFPDLWPQAIGSDTHNLPSRGVWAALRYVRHVF